MKDIIVRYLYFYFGLILPFIRNGVNSNIILRHNAYFQYELHIVIKHLVDSWCGHFYF